MIMAMEVIKIGRKRAAAPWREAAVMLIPIFRRSSANSTMRMAFFARRPMSMMSEICT